MANKKAAKKYIRVSEKNNERNRSARSKVRTYLKKVRLAITSGTKENAMKALKDFEKVGMKSVSKNIFHINTVARLISRQYAKIKAMQA